MVQSLFGSVIGHEGLVPPPGVVGVVVVGVVVVVVVVVLLGGGGVDVGGWKRTEPLK